MPGVLNKPNRLEFKRAERLMGNQFEITVVASDHNWANNMLDLAVSEIRRIEKLLTTFSDDSQTNLVNQNSGVRPVTVDKEVLDLIERSLKISRVTDGAFDITYGSIDKRLWNFDRNMQSLPDPDTASQMVRLIDYRNVIVDRQNSSVMLREKGMRIGFGGIGKGYAAERAKALLVEHGVEGGIVNASGDLAIWGKQADGDLWKIGITNPDRPSHPFSYIQVTDMAVATSGNYEKYVMINGQKYSHTINPKTGMPVTGVKSVTILAPDAEIADAMATPVMIMGIKAGMNLINQLKSIGCIMIDDNNKIYTSDNINLT